MQNPYDYDKAIAWLQERGEQLYGNEFKIQQQDHEFLKKLLCYFIKDQITADYYKIDLRKGLALTGPVGVGKTTIMNLMRFYETSQNRFILKSCREVSFEFIQLGYDIIHRYSHQSFHQYTHEPKTYCFDDLGIESNLKFFGNECNVMAEILLSRYDLFISRKLITHITTNLSASEIEQFYGNRVRSRMREMFNLISLDKTTKDKRK